MTKNQNENGGRFRKKPANPSLYGCFYSTTAELNIQMSSHITLYKASNDYIRLFHHPSIKRNH